MDDGEGSAALGRISGRSVWRSPLPRWTVPVVAVVVLVATVVVLVALWRWIDGLALADAEKRAAAKLEAVKVAASIAVGGGGLFALYLAARRQRIQELELAQAGRACPGPRRAGCRAESPTRRTPRGRRPRGRRGPAGDGSVRQVG